MRKIFIDCGSNLGQGLKIISEKENIDCEWDVFCFEVNPKTFERLKSIIDNNKYKSVTYINKGVWIKDCQKELTLEFCPFENDWVGGATNIMESNFNKPDYINTNNIKSGGIIETLDFIKFIKENFLKEDYIVCKMDIEGSEYPVLEKLIENDMLEYFNIFYIEWHNRILYYKYNEERIKNLITEKNITLHEWY